MARVDRIVIAASPGEARLALLAAGEVAEFRIERGAPEHGDLARGRVTGVDRRLGLAFVEIGGARPGILRKPGRLAEGQAVTVRVTAPARRGKGAVLVLAQGEGEPAPPIPLAALALTRALRSLRPLAGVTSAENADPAIEIVADDAATLATIRKVAPTASLIRGGFAGCGAEEALAEALAPSVPLSGGGALCFAETEGGAVIDVDGGSRRAEDANLAALPVIARHLRLRALAGHILIDLIPRGRRHALDLAARLREAIADDPTPTRIAGATPLGMIEMTRDRHRASLAEIMLDPADPAPSAETALLAGLRALLAETAARPAATLALALPPAALAVLAARPGLRAEAEARLGRTLTVMAAAPGDGHAIREAR